MANVKLSPLIRDLTGRIGTASFARGSQVLSPADTRHRRRIPRNDCPCKAWKLADWLWTQRRFEHFPWYGDLTRAHMSGYDHWMKEAVTLATRGHYLPDSPSGSGGWSTRRAIPGHRFAPPGQCVRLLALQGTVTQLNTGPTWDDWKASLHATDTRKPAIGVSRQVIRYWPHWPEGAPHDSATGGPEGCDLLIPHPHDKPLVVEFEVHTVDGTAGRVVTVWGVPTPTRQVWTYATGPWKNEGYHQ